MKMNTKRLRKILKKKAWNILLASNTYFLNKHGMIISLMGKSLNPKICMIN